MAKIKYVEHDGTEHVIDVKTGLSVMEGAVKNNIPSIDSSIADLEPVFSRQASST